MENNIIKYSSVKNIGTSDYVMMGDIRLRQPLPTNEIEKIGRASWRERVY
jgi:hypothetical protein